METKELELTCKRCGKVVKGIFDYHKNKYPHKDEYIDYDEDGLLCYECFGKAADTLGLGKYKFRKEL